MTAPHFMLPIGKLGFNLFTEDLAAMKIENSLLSPEFTFYKKENTYVSIFLAGTSPRVIDTRPKTDAASSTSQNLPAEPVPQKEELRTLPPKPVLRLAYHVIIDDMSGLKPGDSLELSQNVYISTHSRLSEDCEVEFPAWDGTGSRSLRVRFKSRRPVSARSIEKPYKFVAFAKGGAKVSKKSSLKACLINAGQTVFLEEYGVGVSLKGNCQRPLWHFERVHEREKSRHHFLLFSNASVRGER